MLSCKERVEVERATERSIKNSLSSELLAIWISHVYYLVLSSIESCIKRGGGITKFNLHFDTKYSIFNVPRKNCYYVKY